MKRKPPKYPLRAVCYTTRGIDFLECGHTALARTDRAEQIRRLGITMTGKHVFRHCWRCVAELPRIRAKQWNAAAWKKANAWKATP